MQSKGGYDEVVEVPEDVTPTGQFVVSVKITILWVYFNPLSLFKGNHHHE